MAQLPLPDSGDLRILRAIDDYGPIGQGASLAHTVLAENGSEYIIKGPAFTPNHPFVGANELIAARIAATLGLPLLDHCVIEMGGSLYFGSAWMDKPTFYPQTTEALFNQCENKDRVYDLVAFDALICNSDRHEGNLLVRHRKSPNADRHLLLLNDHSHCLVQPNEHAAALTSRTNAPIDTYVQLAYVRNAVVDVGALRTAVEQVESLTDGDLVRIVQTTPEILLPTKDRGVYEGFLRARRGRMRDVIRRGVTIFPNLSGGSL